MAETVVVSDNTGEFASALAAALRNATEQCGLICEGYAKKECPVDTGYLRNSITHETSVDGTAYAAVIGTNTEYAKHVEMGTSKQRAQPYLKPAAADHAGKYAAIFREALSKG